MTSEIRTLKRAFRICFLRFMAQYDDDLSIRADARVIVIVQFGSGDAVADENKRSIKCRRVRKSDRHELFVDFEHVPVELQFVLWSWRGARRQLKLLKIGTVLAHRTKARSAELRSNVIRGPVQFRRAIPP